VLVQCGDRDSLLAHPEHLVLEPDGLAEGRTYVAEEQGSLVGFATWAEAGGIAELEDLFVDPGWRRRGDRGHPKTGAAYLPCWPCQP
jgi:GNAT superfamily N-acetyltransferase